MEKTLLQQCVNVHACGQRRGRIRIFSKTQASVITITFIVGGVRQFRTFLRKGREDDLEVTEQAYEDEEILYSQEDVI